MSRLSRILALAALAAVLASPAYAQKRIGVLGGINIGRVTIENKSPNLHVSSRVGPAFGVVGDLAEGGNFAFRIEPMYVERGAKFADNTGATAKVKYSYVDVPFMVRLGLGTSATRPYVLFGPSVGFLLSAKGSSGSGADVAIKNSTKGSDIGVTAGAGLASGHAGRPGWFLEGRYYAGLQDINDPQVSGTSTKHTGILLLVGATWPFAGM